MIGGALRIVREARLADLLRGPAAQADPPLRRYEASGVVARSGLLWVIFDNTPLVAAIDPGLTPGAPATRLVDAPGRTGYEDIAHDRASGRWFVLVEEAEAEDGTLRPQVLEFDAGFGPLGTHWLDVPLGRRNKGLEGLTLLRRDGRAHLLGMHEDTGQVDVFAEDAGGWRRVGGLELPDLPFRDYSSISVSGDRVAVLSQESSALWVGRLSPTAWAVPDGGAMHPFPRTAGGRTRYGNVEGVTWLDARTLAVVSDRASRARPRRVREVDQSVHVVELPAPVPGQG